MFVLSQKGVNRIRKITFSQQQYTVNEKLQYNRETVENQSTECLFMLDNYNTNEHRCVKVERTDNFTSKYRVIRVIRIKLN